MINESRLSALLSGIADLAAKVPERRRIELAWLSVADLRLLLRLKQFGPAALSAVEVAQLLRGVRNAPRFRRAGVPRGSRYPREDLRKLRWYRWAERSGVPFCDVPGTALCEPVQYAPWMRGNE